MGDAGFQSFSAETSACIHSRAKPVDLQGIMTAKAVPGISPDSRVLNLLMQACMNQGETREFWRHYYGHDNKWDKTAYDDSTATLTCLFEAEDSVERLLDVLRGHDNDDDFMDVYNREILACESRTSPSKP